MTDLSTPEALPRGPLTDSRGEPSRNWRNWFEGNRRQNGEVVSGIGTLNAAIEVIQGQLTEIDGSLTSYYGISVDGGGNGAFVLLSDGTAYPSAITLSADEITLDADAINFGSQTEFDTSTETFITEAGGVRTRYGAPFGASSDLLRWYGPDSVPQGSETRTNGYLTEGTDGVVRYGTAPLGWGATAAEAAASNALVPAGVNLAQDTGFRGGTTYWDAVGASGSHVLTGSISNGIRYGQASATSLSAGSNFRLSGAVQRTVPVSPGDVVEIGCYVGGTSGLAFLNRIYWYDAAGSLLSASNAASQTLSLAGGGNISSYHLVQGFATAPASAAWATPAFYATSTPGGSAYIRVAGPFISHARADQTVPTQIQFTNDFVPGAGAAPPASQSGSSLAFDITSTSYANIITLVFPDLTAGQKLKFTLGITSGISASGTSILDTQLYDVTAAAQILLGAASFNTSGPVANTFAAIQAQLYTVPASGARTIRLRIKKNTSNVTNLDAYLLIEVVP